MPRPAHLGVPFLLALPVGAALLRIWLHQESARLGYALSAEEARGSELAQRVQALEVEQAALMAPQALQRLAQGLGLQPPVPNQVQVLGAPHLLGATPVAPQLQATRDNASDADTDATPGTVTLQPTNGVLRVHDPLRRDDHPGAGTRNAPWGDGHAHSIGVHPPLEDDEG